MQLRSALVFLCALVVPASASAQSWREPEWRSIRVNASALDLSTPAGMHELERRIARAVNHICDDDVICRDEAWASTENQVAWAIDRDLWMRRMAEQRIAQLDACGGRECEARLAYHPLPQPDFAAGRGVTVVIVHHAAPPMVYRPQAPRAEGAH
jgi:UrcA family protein